VREQNLAAYFNQRWQLAPRLSLSTGARFDYFHYQYEDALLNQTSTTKTQLISPKLKLHFQAKQQVEFYLASGRGFHSNDALVSVAQNGNRVLPPALGTDLGAMCKITDRILLQTALWYLHMAQEFVYVGDEGIVEAGDASRRFGFDASIRWQLTKHLFADMDYTYAHARTGTDFIERIPLAPRFSSAGGLVYRKLKGINASLRYRYLGNRAANADNTVIAQGYLVFDANLNYTTPRFEAGIAAQNVLNTRWKETQFETESRLPNEASPISEIHFTPGTPFAAKLYAMYKF
jgi:outer membrane receptor protein involved in Fe transport